MSKILVILGATLLAATLFYGGSVEEYTLQRQFESWKLKYNQEYNLAENTYRLAIYSAKMAEIERHNADVTSTYQMGENQFTALTQEEFVGIYLTYVPRVISEDTEEYIPTSAEPNDEVDWRSATRVKDQAQCGSCWAFSAVGAIEALYKVKKGETIDLSEQQLVDCDTNSYGCDGGFPDRAIGWAAKKGLVAGKDYPYVAVDQTCKKSSGTVKPQGYKVVKASNLKAAIADYPVSVCVDATKWSSYKSGVFADCAKSLNHAVLAVGYTANSEWIVKNSWSTGWGEKGFIRLAAGNTCGVQSEAVIAY